MLIERKINGLKRIERIKENLENEKLDLIVSVSPENIFYTSGLYILLHRFIPERIAISAIPRNGEPILIICDILKKQAKEDSWISDIRTYKEFKRPAIDLLIEVIREKNLINANIGIDLDYLSAPSFSVINKKYPNINFIDHKNFLKKIRMIKEPGEIDILKKAASSASKAVESAFLVTQPGDTEKQVANRIMFNLLELGADTISHLTFGSGKRVFISHPLPTDKKLLTQEEVRFDLGGIFQGYFCDFARTVFIKRASKGYLDIYLKLLKIQKKVINYIEVDKSASEIYNYCKKLYSENDFNLKMPFIGHGLGIGLHEYPLIHGKNDLKMQENMTINIEPIVEKNGFFCHIEDLVLITKNGPKVLTKKTQFDDMPIIGQ